MNFHINSIAVCMISVSLSFSSCADKKQTQESHVDDSHQSEKVVLTKEQQNAIKLEVGTITYRNLKTSLKSNGKLTLPPQNQAQVSVLVGGIVKEIPVTEGMLVSQGQTLAILANAEFLQAQQDYLESKSSLDYLKAEFERQQDLQKDNINAKKTFQQAQSNYNTAITKNLLLAQRLRLFNLDPEQLAAAKVKSEFNVNAPISGYIKHINLVMGKYAEPNIPLFEIVDNRFLHIDLTIYEQDVAKVHEGQKLTFSIINDPHHFHTAEIFSINKAFEDNTQTVIAHARIKDADDNLLPGMFIDARIQVDDYKTMALPNDAIVSNGNDHFIYAEDDPNTFRQIQVKIGTTDMGFTEIAPMDEINDSSRIVINGAYYLLSQLTKGEGEHDH